jgi:hypothetical protein
LSGLQRKVLQTSMWCYTDRSSCKRRHRTAWCGALFEPRGVDAIARARSMLDTPQRYPRAGSRSYPSPAAEANTDGSTSVYFGPTRPSGVARGNWIQTRPGQAGSSAFDSTAPRTLLNEGMEAERN